MPTASQIRAARSMVGWTAAELADHAGVSATYIGQIERGESHAGPDIQDRIEKALVAAGIEFTENEGVKRRPEGVEVFDGHDRFHDFTRFLHDYLEKYGGELCIFVTDERMLQKHYKNIHAYRETMVVWAESGKISGRILAAEGTFVRTWADIRRLPKTDELRHTSFYVFGDNFALVSFDTPSPPQIVLMKRSPHAASYLKIFDAEWIKAEKP